MKKLNFLVILFLAVVILFTTSCKKDKKSEDCTLTEANLVGSYKIESAKYKATPTSPEIDGISFLESCQLDDIITYNSNHTAVYKDAGTACDPNGDDTAEWSLSGSILTVDGEPETVENFSCNSISVSSTYNTSDDKITVTFKKQ